MTASTVQLSLGGGTDEESKFTEEQIAYALRQADTGTPVGDVCRQVGVSEATLYQWKKKFSHLGVNEVRRVRQLEDENARLKRLRRPRLRVYPSKQRGGDDTSASTTTA
jgi:putative transposase